MPTITIRTRLSCLVVLSIIAILAVGGAATWGVRYLDQALGVIQGRSMPALTLVAQLRTQLLKSVLVAREGGIFSTEVYETLPNKDDGVIEIRDLYGSIQSRRAQMQSEVDELLARYQRMPKSADEEAQWQRLREKLALMAELDEELQQATSGLVEPGDWLTMRGRVQRYKDLEYPMSTFLEEVEREVESLSDILLQQAHEVGQQADQAYRQALLIIAVVSLISAVLLSLLVLLVVRSVTVPLLSLRTTITEVARHNDFSLRVAVRGRDELAQTATAFNELLVGVQGSLCQVRDGTQAIAKASRDALSAAERMAAASGRQSDAASTMAAAIEQMTASMAHVSSNAREVQARSEQGREGAEQGAQIILEAAREMEQISRSVTAVNATIDQVNEQSGQIQSITHVIREVAEQTNLLALNAAIEAARAGEQGRGFAVVADEVRQLAERTSHSTVDIRQRVEGMQSSVGGVSGSMATIVGQVQQGGVLSTRAAERIVDIESVSRQVAEAVSGITEALHEQSGATEEIAREVESVAQMSRDNRQVALETRQISETLQQASGQLQAAVERFRL